MRTETISASGQNLIVSEGEIRHPKSGELVNYLSFSNGQDVCGVFLSTDTKKELVKFLNKKEVKNGTSSKS